ncbi:MAG: Ger(x)C family spore germination protein [Dethiobacteria bacterium]
MIYILQFISWDSFKYKKGRSKSVPQSSPAFRGRPSKAALALALVLLVALFSTGCWDKREIENLAFLTAWGIDRQENGEIRASAVIVKPFAVAGPMRGGAATPERPFWLASSTGRTVLEAMCNFATFSPRFLFCAHSRFLVFGEESAREGVGEMLDFFERNREPRLTAHLLVVKGMTAAEFLKSEFELVPLPPEGGRGMLQDATNRLGTVVDLNINDFLIMLEEEGIEPVVGCLEVIPKRPAPLEGELKREEIIQSPAVCGAAAFKGDRLVGWLNPAETRGLQWIRGKVKSTPLIVENPADAPYLLGIEVIRARSTIIPSISGGKPRIQIKIELEGNIDDAQGYFDPEKDPALIKKIENRMAEVVGKEIKAVLHRCQQELNTDIFGFGATLNRSFPQEWKRLKNRWETEFPRLEVSLDIEARVRLSGLIIKSIKKAR